MTLETLAAHGMSLLIAKNTQTDSRTINSNVINDVHTVSRTPVRKLSTCKGTCSLWRHGLRRRMIQRACAARSHAEF